MATRTEPTPAQIINAIEAEGLEWVAVGDWAGRCRCHTGRHVEKKGPTGRGWTTPYGFTVHITTGLRYTGADAVRYSNNILVAGNGSTPGPLSQFGIDGDGRVLLVAAGRSNHIGSISEASQKAMKAGSFSLSGSQNLRGSGVDGNTFTYGVEILSPSGPSAVQRASAVKLASAICKLLGIPGGAVHGHGEASNQRSFSDPGMDMGAFRRDVLQTMRARPASEPMQQQITKLTPIKEDPIMAITKAQQQDFNALMDRWTKTNAAMHWLKVNAVGATYGTDLDKNGKKDTAGELTTYTAARIDRIEAALAKIVAKLEA